MEIINSPAGFEWDRHNEEHIRKHNVGQGECEQVFFNIPLIAEPDIIHSHNEKRYFSIGRTNTNRILVIVFTVRKSRIRVITARDASRKERMRYETEENSSI